MDVDWDTGLPSDVLALVAKKGRANQMKIMREVSKSWQQGFELAVRGISIGSVEHPVLPWGLEVAQRFPALTQLGLGNSLIDTAWLETLQTLPNLNRLFLGGPKTTLKISDADMVHLQGLQLSLLDLRGHYDHHKDLLITDAGLEFLRGNGTLRTLWLGYSVRLTDVGLDCLRGTPLTNLGLQGCSLLTDAGLANLRGMSLTSLDLSGCLLLTGAGFAHFRDMPLTWLALDECSLTDASFEAFRDTKTLTWLSLHNCNRIRGIGFDCFSGMPLTYLSLEWCPEIIDAGLGFLRGLPFVELNLDWCKSLTPAGFVHLRGMPLTKLCLAECYGLTDEGLEVIRGMPLTDLDLYGCPLLTNGGLEVLRGLPLRKLCLGDPDSSITEECLEVIGGISSLADLNIASFSVEAEMTDAGLLQLSNLPLTRLDLGWSEGITDAGIANLAGMPLVWLNIKHCSGLSAECKERFHRWDRNY